MGLIRKAAKGSLAIGTGGLSIAAEKGIKAAADGIKGKHATADELSEVERSAGALFKGMSHEEGRNAQVTLFADRVERVKERSRVALSKADQDVEMTPIRTISSVRTKKEGFYTKVIVFAAGHDVEFKFRHDAAALFRDALQSLVLKHGNENKAWPSPPEPAHDVTDQIKKLAELRDAGVLDDDEFAAKKAELLSRL